MLQRKYQELAKVYSKLDFIIYRKHYLIPQKPRRLFINRFIGINNNIIGSFENNLEERINAGFIMRAKDPQEKQRLIQEYHQEMQLKIECYNRDLERYNNRFIQPLRQPRKVSPAIFYYNDHQQQLRQEVSGQKAGIAKMINHFKALPQAMQTAYEKKSADALSIKQKQFEEQKEKFMIPQVKTHYPGLIYNQESKEGLEIGLQVIKYQQLSKERKQKYQERSFSMKEAKQKQLLDFLMQRGLTLKEFKVIKSICAEMAELEGQLKDERKKGKLGEQLEDTEHSKQKDTQTLATQKATQTRLRPKETRTSRTEVDKQFDSHLDFELPEEDNLDFDDEEISVFDLKKMVGKPKLF